MKNFEAVLECLPVRSNEILYRKYEHFGWQIVGWQAAKSRGKLYFATLGGSCRSGHDAPHMVSGRICAKCFIIAKRKNIILKRNTSEMNKEQLHNFWRKQLNLKEPAPNCKRPSYVYIVDNFPYTNLQEAAKLTNISKNVIRYRCEHEDFLDYFSIATDSLAVMQKDK